MSQRSKGRGSAKDHMAAHRTTGEPVLHTAESQQLVSMTPLQPPDFVMQNEFWLHGGIPDVDNSSVKFSALDEAKTVKQMRTLFHGASPNLLLLGEVDGEDVPVFLEYVHKLLKLMTTLGRLDVVLFKKATKVESSEFLMAAMKLKGSYRLSRCVWDSATGLWALWRKLNPTMCGWPRLRTVLEWSRPRFTTKW